MANIAEEIRKMAGWGDGSVKWGAAHRKSFITLAVLLVAWVAALMLLCKGW